MRRLALLALILIGGCLTTPSRDPMLRQAAEYEWSHLALDYGVPTGNFPVVVWGAKSEWRQDLVTVSNARHLQHELMHQFVYSGEHVKRYKGKMITVEEWR